ncbi:acyl-CoA thioesterase [Candidatus Sumerlaeota bacterium]|nr:acyl-CoA thioesterase [Candidatus Sumerlaeota bacterium]
MTRTRRKNGYFEPEPGAPPPLEAQAVRRVRFEEVDALGIVWHGRYASFLEDARAEFGLKYGLDYLDMRREGFVAPIVEFHLDYLHPLRLGDEFTVAATMLWSESARLNSEFRIRGSDGRDIARGYTVQILTDLDGQVLLTWPAYLERWRQSWKNGEMA